MRLTPLDIRHKEFGRSMRGYKDLEVDEFLDDIADEFERLFNENIDYKDKLESLEEKIEQYRNIEDTLKKTLLSAQQQAEEQKQNAQKESDLILRDAELKSRSIVNDSYAERQKIQRSVSALKQKQEDLRFQLKSVIDTYSKILDQEGDLDLGDSGESEFASLSESAGSMAEENFPPGIDAAVSREILGEDSPVEPDAIETEATEEDISFLKDEAVGEPKTEDQEKEAVRFPSLDPSARNTDDDDPFADVEIDTDEHKFKW
ncbi:MAG: DivIVA domain-containing protein [Thermoleophilia bacterium]|nr:DivIVA domain-containing protein [Thermoleophilia bacterium]